MSGGRTDCSLSRLREGVGVRARHRDSPLTLQASLEPVFGRTAPLAARPCRCVTGPASLSRKRERGYWSDNGLPLRPDHRHGPRRAQGGAAAAPRLQRGRAAPGQPQGPGRFRLEADQRAEQTIFEELSHARPDWGCCWRRAARSRAIPTSRAGSSIRSTAPPTSSTASRISRSRSRSRSRVAPRASREITRRWSISR